MEKLLSPRVLRITLTIYRRQCLKPGIGKGYAWRDKMVKTDNLSILIWEQSKSKFSNGFSVP